MGLSAYAVFGGTTYIYGNTDLNPNFKDALGGAKTIFL